MNFLASLDVRAVVGPDSSLKSTKANPLHFPESSKVAILILTISPQCSKCSSNKSCVVSNDKFPTNKISEGGFLDNGASDFSGSPSNEVESLINKFLPFKFCSLKPTTNWTFSALSKST